MSFQKMCRTDGGVMVYCPQREWSARRRYPWEYSMAIQHLSAFFPRPVSVWIPNEVEGQILGGTQTHVDLAQEVCFSMITYSQREALGWLVRQEGQLLYERANYTRPRDRIGSLYPDCLVALGVAPLGDEPYDLVKIGIPPVLVVEIISKHTRKKDIGPKVQAYAEMGIAEYVTFDPRPRKKMELHGYRLAAPGRYVPIPPAPEGGLWLTSVGLRIVPEAPTAPGAAPRLRLVTRTGERLLHADEEAAGRLRAEQERDAAEQKRDAALVRAARLEALLAEHGITSAPS